MRVYYLDGLKGVAALIVMFGHFCGFFGLGLFQIPVLGIFFDGAMAVYLFIILSSFSICCSLDKQNIYKTITKLMLKRYFRLTLPLILPTLFAFFICFFHLDYNKLLATLSHNLWAYTLLSEQLKLNQLTSGIAVGVVKGSALISPLWMMRYIFLGTFICIPLLFIVKYLSNVWCKAFLFAIFTILFYSISSYYSAVIIGVVFFAIHGKENRYSWLISLLCMILMLFMEIFHIETSKLIRSVLILVLIEYGSFLKTILNKKVFQNLNKISYQLFLVHTSILCSICSYCFITFKVSWALWGILILFLVSSITFAYIFTKVDSWYMRKIDNAILKCLKES